MLSFPSIHDLLQTITKLLILYFSLIAVEVSTAIEVGVYINQHSLIHACNSSGNNNNYQILNLQFEISLSNNTQAPQINLSTQLTQQIKSCQALGIKVLLSIGGGADKYNLNSTEPTDFAAYLWNNFLGGRQSNSPPPNDAVFDGVDITNQRSVSSSSSSSWDNWSKLGEELRQLYKSKQGNKLFYLSASPQCSSLEDGSPHSIPHPGVFDYISVQFSGDNLICQYLNGGLEGFWDSWNIWKTFGAGKVFVKLLAAPVVANGMGYIPVDVLRSQVLPELQRSSKFGGVMLWSFDHDDAISEYSSEINPKMCSGGGWAGVESQLSENDVSLFPMGGNYGCRPGFTTCSGTCVV